MLQHAGRDDAERRVLPLRARGDLRGRDIGGPVRACGRALDGLALLWVFGCMACSAGVLLILSSG